MSLAFDTPQALYEHYRSGRERIEAPRVVVEKPKPRPFRVSQAASLALGLTKVGQPPPSPLPVEGDSDASRVLAYAGPSLRAVICATAVHFSVAPEDIVSRRRLAPILKRRAVAMAVAKRVTMFSLPHLGQRFGGYDHTTVLHNARKAERDHAEDVTAVLALMGRSE